MYWFVYTLLVINVASSGKPKVIYSNDQGYKPIGYCDGDNPQALIHFLYYTNEIDLQLIIASGSTNCAPSGTNIIEANNILNLYSKDYKKLNSSSIINGYNSYPTYNYLKSITYQGCNSSSPKQGYPNNSSIVSNKIIEIVDSLNENEYIWYGAGAGLCELSRALHDKPSISSKIKLYSIGSWNTEQDPYSRNYIYNNFPQLWWIESNYTFSGWFEGGNQSGIYSNLLFDNQIINKSGNLGNYYSTIIPSQYNEPNFQEGDGPCYWYYMDQQHNNRNLSDPTIPNWGGQYKLFNSNDRSSFWIDGPGTGSINEWRVDYLNDWKIRLEWLYS